MRGIGQGLQSVYHSQSPARPFDSSTRYWSRPTNEVTPFAASLMEDPRILRRTQHVWGDDILGIGIDGTIYLEDTDWHSNTGYRGKHAVKFITFIDPVTASTGALGVIPGSHHLPQQAQGVVPEHETFLRGRQLRFPQAAQYEGRRDQVEIGAEDDALGAHCIER